MALDALVTAVVETSLNALIRQDVESLGRLARLKGKILRVTLTDINKNLVFVFSQQIDVLAKFEGEPDCSLALAVSTLPKLKDKANLATLIKQDLLLLEGDIDVAQKFSDLLSGVNIDVAEWLSGYTGDVLAYSLVQGAEQKWRCVKKTHQKQQQYASQLLIEEWRIAPGALELVYFADRVEDVQCQISLLDARLHALEKKHDATNTGKKA